MTKVYVKGKVKYIKTIADLRPGEAGYSVPWAYNPTTHDLDESFPICEIGDGTLEMKVHRDLEGDLEIDLSNLTYEFSK